MKIFQIKNQGSYSMNKCRLFNNRISCKLICLQNHLGLYHSLYVILILFLNDDAVCCLGGCHFREPDSEGHGYTRPLILVHLDVTTFVRSFSLPHITKHLVIQEWKEDKIISLPSLSFHKTGKYRRYKELIERRITVQMLSSIQVWLQLPVILLLLSSSSPLPPPP